eukprot:Pgem_evm1s17547
MTVRGYDDQVNLPGEEGEAAHLFLVIAGISVGREQTIEQCVNALRHTAHQLQ